MKLIKTTLRNVMTDDCLSDLHFLAIERDIVLNFEQLADTFTDVYKKKSINVEMNIYFCVCSKDLFFSSAYSFRFNTMLI
jgi:hypothetical protein